MGFFHFDLFSIFVRALALFLILPVHECAHAYAAHKMGDDTAKWQGRMTLNPVKHLDIFGSLMLLLTGFGFAKPVPINPNNFRNPKKGMALSAAAGPISNILLALVLLIVYRILGWFSGMAIASVGLYQIIMQILLLIIQISISLGIFNLLPVPPLDGSRLFLSFLPSSTYFKIMQYERYIMIALFLLLFTGALSIPLSWLSGWVLDLLELITRPISMLGQLIF
ncbi:site-2 protease family protein [Candidatus Soleaferrea massiliensis]|uniref:site-2 protease family protein n=1 Tax=Candidatus Soleaferrea massiliensis TaxID=1470354 RepID=UPI00059066B9|nr:site-2 protease family protein [Candidatus Soleaferrea massiliensis]